ncbi:MAG: sulfatase-like hydrolase/transferase [Thermoanaerobaculia bacterium]|jgi:hypothetical protein
MLAVEDESRLRREVVETTSTGSWEWVVPERVESGRLRFEWSPKLDIAAARMAGPVTFRLLAELIPAGGEEPRSLGAMFIEPLSPLAAYRFGAADLELRDVAIGEKVRLRLDPPGPLLLSDVRIVPDGLYAAPVILVVFDTLRADGTGFDGSVDPTTPNIDTIARGAWTSSRSYASASWTVPSVASLLTGLVPAANEDSKGTPLGIVPGSATVADDFRAAGWSTAAFVANPTLHAGMGFAQGFDTFFTTPYEVASITLPAPVTLKHVLPWVAKHEGEPFFVWIHLLDPHDPYMPPDRPRGTTPFDPGYTGPIVGDEIHYLYLGDRPSPPPRDLRHIEALYHDEVRYADAELGKVWDAFPEELRRRATVVFTADHGEEMGEHGGWKHGPALWEPVVRVPLMIRPGEGRPRPSIAKDLPVSLLDVVPTMLELARVPKPGRQLDGIGMFDPRFAARKSLPAITMLTGGPARAAVVRGSSKLVYFDCENRASDPDKAKDPESWKLAQRLRARLPSLGSFDLARDPGEAKLLPVDAATFGDDWRAIETAVAHTRSGIEFRLISPKQGDAIEVELGELAPGVLAQPMALETDDELRRSGDRLLFSREGAGDVDGFLLSGAAPRPFSLTLTSSTGCVELVGELRVKLVAGAAATIDPAKLPAGIPRFETADAACPGLYVWRADGQRKARSQAEVDEERAKLRALGYVH